MAVTAAGNISGGLHGHTITDPGHAHTLPYFVPNYDGYQNGRISLDDSCGPKFNYTNPTTTGISIADTTGAHTHIFDGTRVVSEGANVTHTHTVALSGSTGNSTGSSSSIPVSISTVPAYYTLVYIKKMA